MNDALFFGGHSSTLPSFGLEDFIFCMSDIVSKFLSHVCLTDPTANWRPVCVQLHRYMRSERQPSNYVPQLLVLTIFMVGNVREAHCFAFHVYACPVLIFIKPA